MVQGRPTWSLVGRRVLLIGRLWGGGNKKKKSRISVSTYSSVHVHMFDNKRKERDKTGSGGVPHGSRRGWITWLCALTRLQTSEWSPTWRHLPTRRQLGRDGLRSALSNGGGMNTGGQWTKKGWILVVNGRKRGEYWGDYVRGWWG